MSLALAHSSVAQANRYWSLGEKYTGHNGHFLTYLNELIKEVEFQMNNKKENSRSYEIRKRTFTYLSLIQKNKLSSAAKIRDNEEMKLVRAQIKQIPLPGNTGEQTTINVLEGEQLVPRQVIPFNFQTNFSQGLENTHEHEVSHYLKLVIDAGCAGQAAEVIQSMGTYNDRTGFATIERLADVFGREAGHLTLLPTTFEWGTKNLCLDWSNFKLLIQTHDYLSLHPGCEKLVVESAKVGFESYNDSHRVLDYVRTQLGDNPSWQNFIEKVDKFLGDTFRDQFERALTSNQIGTGALNTFTVTQKTEDIDQINKVGYGFDFLPKKSKGTPNNNPKGKGKGKKNVNDQGKSSKQQPKAKQEAVEKKTKACAWCQSREHATFQCKTYGDGKWDKKSCNRCKGTGHPQEACANPPKAKKSK